MGRVVPGRRDSSPPGLRSAMALTMEAYKLGETGDHARALELFRQATRADPHLAAAWLGLGRALKEKGEDGEGCSCLLRAASEAERSLRKIRPWPTGWTGPRFAGW